MDTLQIFNLLPAQVEQLLVLLSEKERYVIEHRFSLNNKKKATLEEIGQYFHVTRERIRQVECSALQKLKRNIEKLYVFSLNTSAYNFLNETGGLMKEDELVSKLIQKNENVSYSDVVFILCLDKRFEHFGNTIFYHPYFKLSDISAATVDFISQQSLKVLKKRNDVLSISELHQELLKVKPENITLSESLCLSVCKAHKNFKIIDGMIGLLEWRHIHPRTLRDKIYYILRKQRSPQHFVDIANNISTQHFDSKNLNLQAVHNELIRHPDFVLIGRGIYALKEWGYQPGTVSTVIENVLKSSGKPLNEDEIIQGVLKHRMVKPITVLLNLKNKNQFVRVGRKHYMVREDARR